MDLATKCRHCGVRNRPATPMIRVDSPDRMISRRYYCPYCYDVLIARAAVDVPGIEEAVTDDQVETQLRKLFRLPGTKTGPSRPVRCEDIELRVPRDIVVGGNPLRRYYLQGAELAAHIEEVRRRLCVNT